MEVKESRPRPSRSDVLGDGTSSELLKSVLPSDLARLKSE